MRSVDSFAASVFCLRNMIDSKLDETNLQRYFQVEKDDCLKFQERWSWNPTSCLSMNHQLAWSHVSLTWFLKFSTIFNEMKARPLSWWNRMLRKVLNSVILAMYWFPVTWPWLEAGMSCWKIQKLDVYFWEDKKVSVVQSCFSGFSSTRY